MSLTGAGRTSQGCIRSAGYGHSESAQGSQHFRPQTSGPSLMTVSVRSITPRSTPIQRNFPVPGSQRDP
jgi:hypothetical protein